MTSPSLTSKCLLPSFCQTILPVILFLIVNVSSSFAAQIPTLDVIHNEQDLRVSVIMEPDDKFVKEIGEGISKSITIYMDLFRIWKLWPDEFVSGKKIVRTLQADPIKREYTGLSTEGTIQREKRFKDLSGMIDWALTVKDYSLVSLNNLETGIYYVKITIELKTLKQPSVISYLLFFVPEKDLVVTKKSPRFEINNRERL
jgi:hypothetical protein